MLLADLASETAPSDVTDMMNQNCRRAQRFPVLRRDFCLQKCLMRCSEIEALQCSAFEEQACSHLCAHVRPAALP
jgi:hypothetical protein